MLFRSGTTGTPTLIRWGFPPVEVIALGAGSKIQPVFLSGVDAEGVAGCSVLVQNAACSLLLGVAINSQGTDGASTICARESLGGFFAVSQSVILDFDTGSMKAAFVSGYRQSTATYPYPSGAPIGVSYAPLSSKGELVLSPGGDSEISGGQYATNLPRSAIRPLHLVTGSVSAPNLYQSGTYSVTNTGTLTTFTLPGLVANLQTSFVTSQGLEFEIVNDMPTSGATVTVNANAADNFSNSTKTSYSIPQGGSLRLLGNTDGTNTWWSVAANNGAT